MQHVQFWGPTNIRHHHTKFSHHSELVPGIYAPLHLNMYQFLPHDKQGTKLHCPSCIIIAPVHTILLVSTVSDLNVTGTKCESCFGMANLIEISTLFLCTSKPDTNIKEIHPHCIYNIP